MAVPNKKKAVKSTKKTTPVKAGKPKPAAVKHNKGLAKAAGYETSEAARVRLEKAKSN